MTDDDCDRYLGTHADTRSPWSLSVYPGGYANLHISLLHAHPNRVDVMRRVAREVVEDFDGGRPWRIVGFDPDAVGSEAMVQLLLDTNLGVMREVLGLDRERSGHEKYSTHVCTACGCRWRLWEDDVSAFGGNWSLAPGHSSCNLCEPADMTPPLIVPVDD